MQTANLEKAKAGSFYTICGCGGDLQQWVDGYNEMLKEQGIGRPSEWFVTTGGRVNDFAAQYGDIEIASRDQFKNDLTFLMFPLDGLDVGKLAMFKLVMQDRWFDDIVDNMRMR